MQDFRSSSFWLLTWCIVRKHPIENGIVVPDIQNPTYSRQNFYFSI